MDLLTLNEASLSPSSFFCLPYEDVLFQRIFVYLPLQELCCLKMVSKTMLDVVNLYLLSFCTDFDFSVTKNKKLFTGDTFQMLVESKRDISKLNLKHCKAWLKDEHLIPVLLKNSRCVKSLCLHECYNITNDGFLSLANLHQLQSIDLSYCRELSSDTLAHIGLNTTCLMSLNITGCWNLNDSCLQVVALHNRDLQVVACASCYALTDISITALAKYCRNLRSLDIQDCWRVKDSSVIAINEYCKHLKTLLVRNCTNITEISVARLRPRGVHVDVPKPYAFLSGNHLASHMSPLLQI